METVNYRMTRISCYFSYFAMSSIFCLPPMLFVTFQEMYGISYTLLGTLVLVNFCTQLLIDLVFSFFSKHFNIKLTVRVMPLLTSFGLLTYALVPLLLPQYAYVGLLVGTVLFSVAAGLSEVLISPLIAAIPSDHPDRDMSFLHSLYAWGFLTNVIISALFLLLFGNQNWMYLTLILAVFPLISSLLFVCSPIPPMDAGHSLEKGEGTQKRTFGLALCVACIFLGGAAENTMSNWISSFVESTLGIPKMWCDVGGLAVFAVLLGCGRILYAKYGKNISNVLLLGMISATACYVIVGLSSNVVLSFVACILMGLCVSMLWPGTLIFMEENIKGAGVAAFALMAAGGDFGSSVGPQALGAIIDTVGQSEFAQNLAQTLSISPEQVGMRIGMLITAMFPMIGIMVVLLMKKYFKNRKEAL